MSENEAIPPESGAGSSAPVPASATQRRTSVLRIAAGFYGIVALFAFGFALFSGNLGRFLGEKTFPGVTQIVMGFALGLAIVGLTHIGMRIWSVLERGSVAMARILGPISTREALMLAALSGVGEELLFRGALWPVLGLWGTTSLFALSHTVLKRDLIFYPIFAFAAGLTLGLLRDGTQSVIPPILAHVTINAINLAWLGRNHAKLTAAKRTAPKPNASEAASTGG